MRPHPETVTQPSHDGTRRLKLIGDGEQAALLVDVAVGKEGRQICKPQRSCPVLQQAPIRAEQWEARLNDEPPSHSRR
jgi:hypothetical protein